MIGMGLARIGDYLIFIPYTLFVGLTIDIDLIIFSSQIKDLFRIPIDSLPADFIEKWQVYAKNFTKLNWTALQWRP